MRESNHLVEIETGDGGIPTRVVGPSDASKVGGLLVIPSVYGPAPDLIERLSPYAESALIAFPDPFWRVGGGVVPYGERDTVVGRMSSFDVGACTEDLRAVLTWLRARCNGRVAGLGICFGGPFVLRFAGEGLLDGVVTWHGSRMEGFLKRAADTSCPLRLHFGADDPVTPPQAIEAIRSAFSRHPDLEIVVHAGAVHGFSHDGPAYDEKACRAGLDAVAEVLGLLA